MIPCPYCDREFEKRAGLMRHVTSSHHSEGVVPTNPGGAIEAVVPVEPELVGTLEEIRQGGPVFVGPDPETYAEALTDDQLAPGQERYVDPTSGVTWDQEAYDRIAQAANRAAFTATGLTEDVWHECRVAEEFVADTIPAPTSEQYKQIRALIRSGISETLAWLNIVGQEPPPLPPPPADTRPLRLQQVAFRVREGNTDHIDAAWLLRLTQIGFDAIHALGDGDDNPEEIQPILDRWNEAIQ